MSTHAAALEASAPTEALLRDAALRHLARHAATEARLLRVLERRIDRWLVAARARAPEDDDCQREAAEARVLARRVVSALAKVGAVDDVAFAQGRARSLLRAGRSSAVVARHLVQRGISPAAAREAADTDADSALASALILARRRRVGPFADADADFAVRQRWLAILARAGFAQQTARAALAMTQQQAEAHIAEFRAK